MNSPTNFGQDLNSRPIRDTVVLKGGEIPSIQNHTYVISKDTASPIRPNIKNEIKSSRSERFYKGLAQGANKNFLTRGLHNVIIAKQKNDGNSDTLKTSLSVLPFVSYSERIIRHITFRQLDVFGPSINDTNRRARNWIERTANKLHFRSKSYLIRNNLLFKEGNRLDPIELSDNERLLRTLPYIEDARIIVKTLGELNDSIDILVLTKDVWSNAFDLKINNVYSGIFQLWDRNIFGFGHEIQNNFLWDSRKNPSSGYNGIYTINNIAGTFIKSEINYETAFNTKTVGVNLERRFFTPNVKYAGGITLANTKTQTIVKKDSLAPLRFNSYDVWVGRSFLIRKNELTKTRRNITITARVMNNYFYERPRITENSYYNFQNKTLFLGSIAYTKQSFFKSNFIYNFGRTEDIPVGGIAELTVGLEKNEFFNRRYAGLGFSASNFIWNLGYLYASLNVSSFFVHDYHDEQGIFQGNLDYFSPLLLAGRFHLRQFVNFDLTHGINRFTNEFLTINNSQGITGLINDSLTGNTRLNMHLEMVCFTPWYVFDFRFVVFGFGDFSWIEKQPEYLLDKFPYTGIGLGIRIRNERLVFNTIQIRFSFYPNIAFGSKTKALELSGEPVLNLPSFLPKAPQLDPYQ